MKATIDWMQGGRVMLGRVSYEKVSRTSGKYINSSGNLVSGSTSGQHVTEYSVYEAGKTYRFTYWRTSSSSLLNVAFLDSNGNVLPGSVYGSSSGSVTQNLTTPAGTVRVLVYGIYRSGNTTYNAEASMTPVVAEGACYVHEIRVKPTGASTSQIVWPTSNTPVTYRVVQYWGIYSGSNGDKIRADGGNYLVCRADIEVLRDGIVIQTLTNQEMTPVRFRVNDHLVINGVDRKIFYFDGNKVKALDLGTTNAPYGTAAGVVFSYQGAEGTECEIYVQQQENVVVETTQIDKSYNGYRIELSETDFTTSGGSTVVSGYAQYSSRPRYKWTSGSYSYGNTGSYEESQAPIRITVSPSSGVTVSGTTVTLPANGGTDEVVYTIYASWSSYNVAANATVVGSDTGRVYSSLSILQFSYPTTTVSGYDAFSIPAGGGDVYPVVQVRIMCSVNGSTAKALTGIVTHGETSCPVSGTVNGQNITTNVALTYIGATNGLVSAISKRTNEDSGRTVVASGLKVRASKAGLTATSSSATVYQQRNKKWVSSAGNFHVTAFSIVPKIGGTTLPYSNNVYWVQSAASASIDLDIRASGSGKTTKYTYTALDANGNNETSGGDTLTMNNEPVASPSVSITSGGASVSVSDKRFTAVNAHQLSEKAYSVSATYEDASSSISIRQYADEKIDDGTPNYVLSLTQQLSANELSAAGGEILLRASAYYTTGKKWRSDNTPVSGESSDPVYEPNLILLQVTQSGGYTPEVVSTGSEYRTFRLRHRDMKNIVTTDTASVYMEVGGKNVDTHENPLNFSVSNSLGETEYPVVGDVEWGDPYTGKRNFNVALSINRYKTDQDPAPFVGATTGFSVSAYHQEAQLHDGIVPTYYYQHYTSWRESADDDEHRYLSRTTYDPNTYQAQLVPGSGWETVWGDNYSVERFNTGSWLTIDVANRTLTFSAQSVDAPQRIGIIKATNIDDTESPQSYVTGQVVQQAYQSLSASPLTGQFGWRGTGSIIVDVTARYTKWKVSILGNWLACSISTDGGITYTGIDENAEYGITTGVQQAKLKFVALTPNDEEHNPSGYQQVRIGDASLIPTSEYVSAVHLNLTQEAYSGGLPTNE